MEETQNYNKKNKTLIRDTIILLFLLILLVITILYNHKITYFLVRNVLYRNEIVTYPINEYSKKESYNYIQYTEDYTAKSKQDLMNIFYTTLDNGWTTFTFYCSQDYAACQTDLDSLSDMKDDTLSNINNFVSPYNSFNKVQIEANSLGKITINIEYIYSEEQKSAINSVINADIKALIKDDMNDEEKIKTIHDFIINNTVYDSERAAIIQKGEDDSHHKYESHIAYGPLIQGIGICGGYTDAMALFLDKFGIDNYRITTKNHAWNYVKVNNKWLHLDLTWDDPVIVNSEQQILMHNFFLINEQELIDLKPIDHDYDRSVYTEK